MKMNDGSEKLLKINTATPSSCFAEKEGNGKRFGK
jgi:hypothetical protein